MTKMKETGAVLLKEIEKHSRDTKPASTKDMLASLPAIRVRNNDQRAISTTGKYVISLRLGDAINMALSHVDKVYLHRLNFTEIGISENCPPGKQAKPVVIRRPTVLPNGEIKYKGRAPWVEFPSVTLKAEPHVRTGLKMLALCQVRVEHTEYGPVYWFKIPEGIVLTVL
jgi:hypothetical protein